MLMDHYFSNPLSIFTDVGSEHDFEIPPEYLAPELLALVRGTSSFRSHVDRLVEDLSDSEEDYDEDDEEEKPSIEGKNELVEEKEEAFETHQRRQKKIRDVRLLLSCDSHFGSRLSGFIRDIHEYRQNYAIALQCLMALIRRSSSGKLSLRQVFSMGLGRNMMDCNQIIVIMRMFG